MQYLRAALPIVLMLVLAACTPSLSPQEAAVRVTSNPNLLANCDFLGQVQGAERLLGGTVFGVQAQENAILRLKQETAKLGGDTVSIAASASGAAGASVTGEAYRCAE